MDAEKAARAKTIREAVEDGSLIDVTETARSAGMACRTFLTSSAWANKFGYCKAKLYDDLKFVAGIFAFIEEYERVGTFKSGSSAYILEPSEEFGLILIVAESSRLDELNIKRTTGESPAFVM